MYSIVCVFLEVRRELWEMGGFSAQWEGIRALSQPDFSLSSFSALAGVCYLQHQPQVKMMPSRSSLTWDIVPV